MLGKLHPLVVHLPIGFIYLVFLLETYAFFRSKTEHNGLIKTGYLVSAAIALVAVGTGLLLDSSGKFTPGFIAVHKWLGILVLVLAGVIYSIKSDWLKLSDKASYGMSALLVLAVSITGHYGGMLTHGADFFRGSSHESHLDLHPDSLLVYRDFIQPIMDAKCTRCHNDKYPSGGLNTSTYNSLLAGGNEGPILASTDPWVSPLIERATLPTSDERYMPPDGASLSATELEVLVYWLSHKADTALGFVAEDMSKHLLMLLHRDYGLDYTPRRFVDEVIVDSIAPSAMEMLNRLDFQAQFIGEENFLLDVAFTGDTLQKGSLEALKEVSGNVAYLDLSGIHLSTGSLQLVAQFQNLVVLDLHSTNVVDSMLTPIVELEHVEVVNLYDTNVTEAGVRAIAALPALTRMYVWQTDLSDDVLAQIRQEYSNIDFVGALSLQVVVADTTKADAEK